MDIGGVFVHDVMPKPMIIVDYSGRFGIWLVFRPILTIYQIMYEINLLVKNLENCIANRWPIQFTKFLKNLVRLKFVPTMGAKLGQK